MSKQYDLIVIGTGMAATTAAAKCRAAGWNVAIVDYQPFGGTCALRGCDPKKVLVGAAEIIDRVRRMQGKGLGEQDLHIDWGALMAFKRSFTDSAPSKIENSLEKQGIDAFHGRARFRSPSSLEVAGQLLASRHFLIAAGAKPMRLGIPGEEHLITSDRFLELEELPQRIVVVGGGFIAFEFAHIAVRAGAKVTVLEQLPRFLRPFDPDLVSWLVDRSRQIGIDLHAETSVEAVEKDAVSYKVRTSTDTSGWYTARRVNEDCSGYKILIEEGSERILGAHLIGPHAEEVINLFALAIRANLSAKDLKTVIWSYPTATSDISYML
ncbi:NAD(P)/FAD-dependent oxidoreductase [Herbaspirillum sp. VT-16-41]|uniref:FAD-dependent oxidoreductase n=1 Tax=Herbaspirillum sp. VT-16-41 TaxID=1953765 RepID=UPI000980F36A|nr:NAD(P)/FAD-dependent oxidoreductase [Herbaspirillum sp. VT-16-41]ONN67846.1 hypothetical protein BTM36_04400 [Herbaspirillum sp. VT-16-41]